MRKYVIPPILLLLASVCLAQVHEVRERISPSLLGNVLHCLRDFSPPQFSAQGFRVRYVYRPESQSEGKRLILLIYAPHESAAMLFEIGVTGNYIACGAPTNFKESAGRLRMENISDPVFRHEKEAEFNAVARRPAVTVPIGLVKSGKASCVWPGHL